MNDTAFAHGLVCVLLFVAGWFLFVLSDEGDRKLGKVAGAICVAIPILKAIVFVILG